MKLGKAPIAVIAVVILAGLAAYGVSMHQRFSRRNSLAERIFSMGNTQGGASVSTRGAPPETIEGLRNAIAAYEKQIEQYVALAARTGSYWKILAVRLQDRGLHGEALEALENAIYYNPEDPTLHYSAGISAGIMAKSLYAFSENENYNREHYFDAAEKAFLRAIELDDRYLRPRYGLGVLYTFELDRPGEAIPHLEKCLEISRNDVDTMFVLARSFYMLNNYQAAVDIYDRIITLTRDEKKRIDAQNNRQMALGHMYG